MSRPVLEAHDLTKRYGATAALEGLDLSLLPGEVFGFLGPNGAGKTTTIRLLLDLIRPTRGSCRLFGLPSRHPSSRARVGYVPDAPGLDGRLTGRETLAFFDALRPKGQSPSSPARRRAICERLSLAEADLDRPVRADSRGTRQKIAIAAAFQHDPDLLILDEPTTSLDPLVREAVFEMMREARLAGKTVFHSSHVISEVERTCTRVGIVRRGRLVAVERIEDLRRAAARRMVVRFEGQAPAAELSIPGVAILEHEGARVVLKVEGRLDPLLAVLARHRVIDLVFPESDLEEAFAAYYRGEGAA